MGKRVGMEVSLAVAEAVRLCDVDVISAYPITPQTHIVEHLSELIANGELDAEFIPVESEHTAMSACVGASAAGARTYTSTSAQGLALMHEIIYIASSLRLPIVMTVVNRAMSGPISIWNDHSDIMAERDTGWIQYFVENGQEAVDHTFIAYRVAEDKEVMLPVMINLDGFILSHVIEPIILPDKEEVDKFLPPFTPAHRLDVDSPITMGPVGIPEIYTESKWAQEMAIRNARKIIDKVWEEFAEIWGRRYHAVECYKVDDAEYLFITMGAISETAMSFVDKIREAGEKVGLLRIRLWRPFPKEDLLQAIQNKKALIVVDRAVTLGGISCPVALEVRGALYEAKEKPFVSEFVAGLGGRDVALEDFKKMLDRTKEMLKSGSKERFKAIQVRE